MQLHLTRNPLSLEVRIEAIDLLSKSLATCFDLYTQTKSFHWNLKGKEYIGLHLFADELAAYLIALVDWLAERITALGGTADGSIKATSAATLLAPFPLAPFTTEAYLGALSDRYASFAEHILAVSEQLEEAGDAVTANHYLEVAANIEKFIWQLESHLK